MIDVINLESLVTPLPMFENKKKKKKKKKKKSQTMTQPKPKSQGPKASRVLVEDSDKSQSVSSGQSTHPQDIEGNTQCAVKGFHSSLDEGTRSSKPLFEGKPIDAKDLGETNNPLVSDPDHKKGKTSLKVKPYADTLILTTVADIQVLLGDYEDGLKDVSDEQMLEAREEMDEEFIQSANEETQHAHFTKTLLHNPFQQTIGLLHLTKINLNPPKIRRLMHQTLNHHYVLKLSGPLKTTGQLSKESCIEDFLATTFKQYENTYASLRNYEKIITQFKSEHATGLNRILANLQEVHNVVKEDPALNKKVLEAAEAYTKNSSNLTELLTMVKNFDFPNLKSTVETFLAAVTAQNDHLAKWAESSTLMAWSVGPWMTSFSDPDAPVLISFEINEVATEAGVDPKTLQRSKAGQEFIKIHDAEIKVHNREHMEKLKKARELKKKSMKKYRWTIISRRKPKAITNIHIHLNTKPVAITIYKGNDRRNFKTEGDSCRNWNISLPALGQVLSLTSGRKRKAQELEYEVHIPGLECNRSLPEGVQFVNNQVIEHPEKGIFFVDVFGDEAFQ
uniref:Copia protein n=1 Tax=Tanacetum cinerariifolium TaxID=118510 RepID=A0A6L2LWN0_TANCI|nr:copia protein [Tanacetum cinerariifolium]